MSISGIGQSGQLSRINGISFLDQYAKDSDTTTQVTGATKDSSQISQMGQWMMSLADLSTTDADAFKKLAQQISEELSQQARSATSVGQGAMLSGLSRQFSQAASTGSMDSLKPKGPPPSQGADGKGGGGMVQVESIISQSLSSLSNASTASSSTASWEDDGMGGLMKQLGNLLESDPEAFKQVTGQISEQLAQAGTSSSGSSGLLNELSAKFAEASGTGSMESLKPGGPPPPPPGSQDDSGDSGSGASTLASSNQELFAMLQSMMGGSSSSLTDASSWTTFLSAMKAYGSSA